jgi:hypothetical protein
MKKWLAILLVLITAAGTFIPCCGVDDCCTDTMASKSGHDDHQDEGTCSPFFACATCPGSVELTKTIQLPTPETEKVVHHQPSLKFVLPVYTSSFWQPPRAC